ncbi:MAG: SAM-dependent methyltransferase [Salinarimonas sp.]|nr:SAM-dependent methyltransferase [Salinarimonas sp.]
MIALDGPITVERYMALCLSHPQYGYYMTRDPLGLEGDFITAPEISQMFGELVGLWAAQVWLDQGAPETLQLVELGPGRGTLMRDALRAAAVAPGFLDAVQVHLVETSPVLIARQREVLARAPTSCTWHTALETVPPGPMIVIANEFFDALPLRQFVRSEGGWHERLVGLAEDGSLCFGLAREANAEITVAGREGAVVEWPMAGIAQMRGLAGRIARDGGAALVIDYGHVRSGLADTLQAIRNHGFTDVLAEPGEADVTAHVDFAQLAAAARSAGAHTEPVITQGAFLRALGIDARTAALSAAAPERATEIAGARARLVDATPEAMGGLFKALGLRHPAAPALPGFG